MIDQAFYGIMVRFTTLNNWRLNLDMIECKPGQIDIAWVDNEAKDTLVLWEVMIEKARYDLLQAQFEVI